MLLAVVERAPPANRTVAQMLGPRSVLALGSPIVAAQVLSGVGGRSEITISSRNAVNVALRSRETPVKPEG